MSESRVINSSSLKDSIPTEVGIQAAKYVSKIARDEAVDIALAGGIALHIFGFTRATTDVDMVARAVLSLEARERLSVGGESYDVPVTDRIVSVDVIVRTDELAKIYETALAQAKPTDLGINIISPEWLVVMKHFAARAKDQIDVIWLLQQDGLVDRQNLEAGLTEAVGAQSAFFIMADLKSEFDYADFLKHREQNKYGGESGE